MFEIYTVFMTFLIFFIPFSFGAWLTEAISEDAMMNRWSRTMAGACLVASMLWVYGIFFWPSSWGLETDLGIEFFETISMKVSFGVMIIGAISLFYLAAFFIWRLIEVAARLFQYFRQNRRLRPNNQ